LGRIDGRQGGDPGRSGTCDHDVMKAPANGRVEYFDRILPGFGRRSDSQPRFEDNPGVAAVYNRHAYLDERKAALHAWSRRIEVLVS
jgi:hypothetical protein